MQIPIITCWQGHISINWIGDGIQNCCNYCNFLANCRVGGEYFTSNKWKTVFRLKLVYSILDILFYISGAFCSQAGLCLSAAHARPPGFVPSCCHSPAPGGLAAVPGSPCRGRIREAGAGAQGPAEIFVSLFWLPCQPFCLFRDHATAPLPARERLARSGPAGKVIFLRLPSFPMHKQNLDFARGGLYQIESSHLKVETTMMLAHTPQCFFALGKGSSSRRAVGLRFSSSSFSFYCFSVT